jgi:hypothetical protein
MNKFAKHVSFGLVISTFASGLAYAAIQGSLGTTSQGSVTINASKANSVQISGLIDLVFASASTTVPASIAAPACIYSTSGSYSIQATSTNGLSSTFRLKGTGTNFISYTVGWTNAASGGTPVTLLSGTASSSFAGANTTSLTCGGVMNAHFDVAVDSATFLSAPAGGYSDTLTLVLAPV